MDDLLNDQISQQISEFFQQLTGRVKILVFTKGTTEESHQITAQLVGEVAALSDKLSHLVVDVDAKPALAEQYGVLEKTPAIVVAALEDNPGGGEKIVDLGIRLLGVPAGHEFGVLIQDIMMVSTRNSGLSEEMIAYVKALKEPLHLEVFATPT